MKISKLVYILYISLFILFSTGCKKKEIVKENNITFQTIKLDTAVFLFNDSTKPQCNFELEAVYPVSGENEESIKLLQQLFILDYYGEKYKNETYPTAAHQYMKNYVENYLLLEEDFKKFNNIQNAQTMDSWMNYVEKSSSTIYLNAGNIISYFIEFYTYTGGDRKSVV